MSEHLGRTKDQADYGLGEHAFDADRMGLVDKAELTDKLIATFESDSYQPPRLPAVAMELMTLSQNPDVEFKDIEKVLEQDAMLAGEILSIARSAFYGGIGQITSLHQALVRLGLAKLRQVVMQAAMSVRVFRSKAYGPYMDRVREHSRITAHAARIVSQYTPFEEEQAFLCGLLHDVGIAGILLILGDVKRGEKPPELAVLWPTIHDAHMRAGERMVKLWDLPVEIAMVVGAHHDVCIQGFDHPLAATICLAEDIVRRLDRGLVPTVNGEVVETKADWGMVGHGRIDQSTPQALERARTALGITEPTEELILQATRDWLEKDAE
ncbi:hypothetical protein ABI59_09250 [Acidobacteria bacterium Mor1]|nr:hypothetical protein ABI59_09250 [Acidobacteria bacterium Mor1]